MQPVTPAQPGLPGSPMESATWPASRSPADSAQLPPGLPQPVIDPETAYHKKPRGRRIWALSGAVTIVAVGLPLFLLIARAGTGGPDQVYAQPISSHSITITDPVTSVSVQSYGMPVEVVAGPVSRVQVHEDISYDPSIGIPAVISAVSHGVLTLAAPACANSPCGVQFTVVVPVGVSATVISQYGSIVVSGVASANLDSGGGNVVATRVGGALTVSSDGGDQRLASIGGPVRSDSGGGNVVAVDVGGQALTIGTEGGTLTADDVAVQSATISTGSGDAQVSFATTVSNADITTNGGNADIAVPGGPYAVTADSNGGTQTIAIATDPAARDSLTVTTGGGNLTISPYSGAGSAKVPVAAGTGFQKGPVRVPLVPPVPPVSK